MGKDVVNNLSWIDEAFAKDYVDELEAACCLTEGQNRVYFGDKVSSYFVDYEINPILRRNYRVITTWNFPRRCLFDFINKAIAKNIQNFRREFLLEKCNESFLSMSPDNQKRFILDYYHISCASDLMIINEDVNGVDSPEPESLIEKKSPWIINAIRIYDELDLKNKSHLSMEQRAEKVANEMTKRHSNGEKGMTKKGGKEVPAVLTILRHAFKSLE